VSWPELDKVIHKRAAVQAAWQARTCFKHRYAIQKAGFIAQATAWPSSIADHKSQTFVADESINGSIGNS
jgi:hypothetical protein